MAVKKKWYAKNIAFGDTILNLEGRGGFTINDLSFRKLENMAGRVPQNPISYSVFP